MEQVMAATKIKDIGVSTAIGDRPRQEDRYIVCKPGALSHTDYALFAVCDGHAGATASDHISQHLPRHIDYQLNDASFDESREEVIQDAIRAEDDALRDLGCLSTGSTVALALLDTKKNILTTADLGDSYVLLGQTHQKGWHKTNRISQLSEPQKPDDREERHRIRQAGGVINYGTDQPRVGPINMSRAHGDHELKQPAVQKVESALIVDGGGPATGDLVSNVAHMGKRELKGKSLLMLATDGVGEAPKAEEAAKHALKLWENGVKAEDIAPDLTRKATTMPNSDNCTVIVVVLDSQ